MIAHNIWNPGMAVHSLGLASTFLTPATSCDVGVCKCRLEEALGIRTAPHIVRAAHDT